MPYASAFERDIFISYCHTDNENPIGDGWIEVFHQILALRLRQILGVRSPEQEVHFWRDTRLQGNEAFAAVLEQELAKVALVVSVMSPSYVHSDWCKRELRSFCCAAQGRGGLTVGNKTRVFKVIKTPVERDMHPAELQGQIGYEFFTLDKDTRIPREYTLTRGDSNEYKALEVINELAYNIRDTLDQVNQTVAAAARQPGPALPAAGAARPMAANETTPAPEAPRHSVYLAESSFELDDERGQIRRDLTARGIRVLPEGELPVRHPQQFRQAVEAALAQCVLAVHPIASSRALVLPGGLDDTVGLQNLIAAERCLSSPLARLIWIPQDGAAPVDDPRQRQFIASLHDDPAAHRNAQVLTQPVQSLIARIHDTLRKLDEPRTRAAAAPAPGAARALVYLLVHPDDEALAEPLRDHLFNCGLEVRDMLSDPSASEKQIFESHKASLVECDAALVCYGRAGELWLRAQLSDTQRAVGWRDGRAMAARAVYLGPPDLPAKGRLRIHDCLLLDGRAGFGPALLQPLLDALAAPPGPGA